MQTRVNLRKMKKCPIIILQLMGNHLKYFIYSSVQSLSCVQLFATPWTAARLASLSITNSQSLLKLMSIALPVQET